VCKWLFIPYEAKRSHVDTFCEFLTLNYYRKEKESNEGLKEDCGAVDKPSSEQQFHK